MFQISSGVQIRVQISSDLNFLKRFQQTSLSYYKQKAQKQRIIKLSKNRKLTFAENAISNSPKSMRIKPLGVNRLSCFISMKKQQIYPASTLKH